MEVNSEGKSEKKEERDSLIFRSVNGRAKFDSEKKIKE